MKELTLVLDDDKLYGVIETEARATGHTVQEVVVQALRQWREDVELDAAEREDLAEARREWQEKGGAEAHAFFERLREEEAGSGVRSVS